MKKGFTLIELLVVVLIIGILSAIALPQYTVAVEKSRAAEALINLKALKDAIEVKGLEKGHWSEVTLEDIDISIGTYDEDEALFKTKYFNYEYDGEAINAYRVNGEYSLYYDFADDDKGCVFSWSDTLSYKVCASLCGRSVTRSGGEDSSYCPL